MKQQDMDVEEKIILFLYLLDGKSNEIEAPMATTQAGLSSTLGFRRTHATRILLPLERRGLITREKKHITDADGNRRMLSYGLTDEGRMVARKMLSERGLSRDKLEGMFNTTNNKPTNTRKDGDTGSMEDICRERGLTDEECTALELVTGGKPDVAALVLETSFDGEENMEIYEKFMYRYLKLKEAGRI